MLVWNNRKSQKTTFNSPGCGLPETSIDQAHEGLTKFCSMFEKSFKELDQIHSCPIVTKRNHREKWIHWNQHAMVTDTEDRDSNDDDSMITSLSYPEESDNGEDNPSTGK